jgi:hypothetical protein
VRSYELHPERHHFHDHKCMKNLGLVSAVMHLWCKEALGSSPNSKLSESVTRIRKIKKVLTVISNYKYLEYLLPNKYRISQIHQKTLVTSIFHLICILTVLNLHLKLLNKCIT